MGFRMLVGISEAIRLILMYIPNFRCRHALTLGIFQYFSINFILGILSLRQESAYKNSNIFYSSIVLISYLLGIRRIKNPGFFIRAIYKNTATFYITHVSPSFPYPGASSRYGARSTRFLVTGIPARPGSGLGYPRCEFYRGLYKVTTKAFTTSNKNKPLLTQDNSFIE